MVWNRMVGRYKEMRDEGDRRDRGGAYLMCR